MADEIQLDHDGWPSESPIASEELDRMWAEEMERRDREAAEHVAA